jgi:hypothetical protein
MTGDDLRDDPVLQAIGRWAGIEPDPVHRADLRSRCRALLDPRARTAPPRPHADRRPAWRRVEPIVLAVASAIFLVEVLRRALTLYPL